MCKQIFHVIVAGVIKHQSKPLDSLFCSASIVLFYVHACMYSVSSPVSRQYIRDKQTVLSQLQSQTSQLAQEQLPGLIQEMAALQVSTVLHGDYSLKIARQDYFTSKQDKVCAIYLLACSGIRLIFLCTCT